MAEISLPIDIIHYLKSFCELNTAIILCLSSKNSYERGVHYNLRRFNVTIKESTGGKEIVRSCGAFSGSFNEVSAFQWIENGAWTRYDQLSSAECKAFFDKFSAQHLRRIHICIKSAIENSGFVPALMKAYDANILEELYLINSRLDQIPLSILNTPLPRLTKLVLDRAMHTELILSRIAKNITTLQHLELHAFTQPELLVSESFVDLFKKVLCSNKRLNAFWLSGFSYTAIKTLDHFVTLFGFPDDETPTLRQLESECFKRLGADIKILRFHGHSVWDSLYRENDLVGLRDGDLTVADADFDHFFINGPIITKLSILMDLVAVLYRRRPLHHRAYLRWAEQRILHLTDTPAAARELASAHAVPSLFLLGSILGDDGPRDADAVKQLRRFSREMLKFVPDAISWLWIQTFTPLIDIPRVPPLLPAILSCTDWCRAGVVILNDIQMANLSQIIQSYPRHIESLIKDVHYDPLAKLKTGETLASWIIREAGTFGQSALMVPWAEYALESFVQSGVKLSWQATNLNYGFFCCLMESPAALQAMAAVFDRFDEVLSDEKYLGFRTNASCIPRLKSLLQTHSITWPDDPPIEDTLEKLSHQLWREVLWLFSNDKANFEDGVSLHSPGSMRAAVLTLIQTFPRVPRFVVEFMRGKHDDLVQQEAPAIRESLRDLFPKSMDGHQKQDCNTM
eukprot:TRINITY_DN2049_c0_g1_i1.p1 TRINITY_DN2049_c0_g1~~TRINITY_DN2049_c0_g1_i1.p1  ORF type:complete len:684 (-),score=79.24 TRINITY_DN2049_c0_g1_i1:912-2963(-)